MAPSDERPASTRLVHMVARLGLALSAAGAVFLLYLALVYPAEVESRGEIVGLVAAALAGFGVVVLAASWAWLAPVRHALEALAAGRPVAPEAAALASRRAAAMPRNGALLTLAFWSLGILLIEPAMGEAGVEGEAAVASLFAGGCTGLVSALLFYYLAMAEIFPVRLRLPGSTGAVRGAPIGLRVLATAVAVLAVGVAFVGASAWLDHNLSLKRSAVSACERALQALVAVEAPSHVVVQAASRACEGSAAVAMAGRVLAAKGADDLVDLPPGPGPRGTLLTMPLRNGATLFALVGESQAAAGDRFGLELALYAAIALLLAVGVALVAARAITAPVRGLAEGAEAVARGDLTREVPILSGDELGSLASSFGAMGGGLRRMVQSIQSAAAALGGQVGVVARAGAEVQQGIEARRGGVAGATAEMTEMDRSVAAVGRDVAGLARHLAGTGAALGQFAAALDEVRRHGAEVERAVADARKEVQAQLAAAESTRGELGQLAAAAKTTLATVAESGRTARSLTDAAVESERVSRRLAEETQAGRKVVEEGVRGVEALRGVVAETRRRVQELGARSSDITVVVDFIADVARRTNLLSLNAAIIAAQAGEQGKPFGVVADQIRDLASQIGSSIKRIEEAIGGVGQEVLVTSALIQESDALAAASVERAREGSAALERIAEQARHGREVAASIAPAALAHADANREIQELAARVVDLAQGFQGVELLVRGGRSIDALGQSLAPLTGRVGRALEEQAALSRRQVESLEEINQTILRLNRTVSQHGEGTARVLRTLEELVARADDDRRVAEELAQAAAALTRHAGELSQGLAQFRI